MDELDKQRGQAERARAVRQAWLVEQQARQALAAAVQATGEALIAARESGAAGQDPVEWARLCSQLGGVSRQKAGDRLRSAQAAIEDGRGITEQQRGWLHTIATQWGDKTDSHGDFPQRNTNRADIGEPTGTDSTQHPGFSQGTAGTSAAGSVREDARTRLQQAARRGADQAVQAAQRQLRGSDREGDNELWESVRQQALEAGRQALRDAPPGLPMGQAIELIEQAAAVHRPTLDHHDSGQL